MIQTAKEASMRSLGTLKVYETAQEDCDEAVSAIGETGLGTVSP
jgi:hypothetical protein